MKNKLIVAAVVGLPNAGKSTLVNAIVGQKVSIVSYKVQTTRLTVRGVINKNNTQIVLVDTPGIFKPKLENEKKMVKEAWNSMRGVDYILLIVDVTNKRSLTLPETFISGILQRQVPVLLVLNKIDKLANKELLLPIISQISQQISAQETFLVSAFKKNGLEKIINYLESKAIEQSWMFNEDEVTDMPERVFAAELTREHIMRLYHQEIPYKIKVETETWSEQPNEPLTIHQVVYVQLDSHKKIIIGDNAQSIKKLGMAVRLELQKIMNRKIRLFIHVKVRSS